MIRPSLVCTDMLEPPSALSIALIYLVILLDTSLA